MIRYIDLVRAAEDVVSAPRPIEAAIHDLGIDADDAAICLGQLAGGVISRAEATVGLPFPDEFRNDAVLIALMGFVIGAAVGREAAHDEAPA
jgi:hypothetical protein